MINTKSKIEELKNKVLSRQKNEKIEEAKAEIEEEMKFTGYDIFKDKNGKYMMAELRFDPESMKAYVSNTFPVNNKVVAVRYGLDKENLMKLVLGKKGRIK